MKRYKFFNIKWDMTNDDEDDDDGTPELPNSVELDVLEDFNAVNEGADLLSDIYGFCVFSFEFEPVP